MKKIYQIVIILAILILIYVFQNWLRTFVITTLGGFTKKETVTKIETEFIEGKIDTIAVFNHYVSSKGIILNPEPKIIYETKYDTIRDTIYSTKLKQFEVAVKDSLIDGKITIKNYFNGDLFSADFKYKPLFPKYIKRVDTIFKTTTITETLSTERAKFGVGLGYDWTTQSIQYLGSYTLKNDWQIVYEYETPLNRQVINGIPNISNSSIKILKNF